MLALTGRARRELADLIETLENLSPESKVIVDKALWFEPTTTADFIVNLNDELPKETK